MSEEPRLRWSLLGRYAAQIEGTLECLDRVIIAGTLVEVAHVKAVESRLASDGTKCFDIKEFAGPLRRAICDNAKALAAEAGLEVEFIRGIKLPQGRAHRRHPLAARQPAESAPAADCSPLPCRL